MKRLRRFAADSLVQQATPSSRLLLYLEWILVIYVLITIPLVVKVSSASEILLLPQILLIAAFGAMGLKVPTQRRRNKIAYTLLEFGIIFLPSLLSPRFLPMSLLGLVILIRSFRMFGQLGRIVVVVVTPILALLTLFLRNPAIGLVVRAGGQVSSIESEQFDNIVFLLRLLSAFPIGLILAFGLLLINSLQAESQSREKLATAHNQLRQYALRIEDQATLQERNRIAREIHDAVGHALTAQSIQLENALLFLQTDPDKARAFLTEARQLGTQALREVRQSVATLRSNPLLGQNLSEAIATLVRDFQATTAIAPDCNIHLPRSLPPEISNAIYRIFQEALTNIAKHANATQVTLSLQESDTVIHFLVNDNGKGFNPDQNTTGFGLQGIQERIVALGGELNLVSQPGCGCLMIGQIPQPKLPL
ncbi:MAG: sensor histidine kinase [Leptolyngbyaceae cyanobacterium SL_5_9]|nr:sensor histidine kinase [Leptolyngbyaceae cyanobacterium SM1_4_3]NJN56282.1 sensor histidine kinase [Leptolyngbyaceae cyanobacterium SL_5_9]